jgi:hypothetical protein
MRVLATALGLIASMACAAGASASAPSNTSLPSISGTAQVGATLTANSGTWTGVPTPTFSYQWQRCVATGTPTPPGVTWTSRTPAANNDWLGVTWGGPAGQEKFVAVAGTGSGNRVMTSPDGITWSTQASASDKTWYSVAWGDPPGAIPGQFVAVSGDRPAPANLVMTSPDGITWTAQTPASANLWRSIAWGGPAGQEKFVAVSQNLGDGPRVMTSQAQVPLSCTNISGETNSAYTLAPADYEAYMKVEVTAANGVSPAGVASSPSSAQVAGRAPGNTAAPSLSGTAQVGQTLTANSGIWTGYPTPDFSFQWRLCDAGGGNCQDIAGATSSTYTLASTDQEGAVRVEVNATNPVGSASATSAPTSPVEATPLAPSPPPVPGLLPESSTSFSVRSSRVNGGVITTVVRVPGAGRTTQVGRVRGAKGVDCSSSRRSRSAGRVILTCRVAARALPRKCGSSVRISVRTTFTPTGGIGTSRERVVPVRKRCPTPRVTG